MNRLMVVFFLCLLTLNITGCNKVNSFFGRGGDIDLVKKGLLGPYKDDSIAELEQYDKSMTIGQAIDNYGAFKNTKWEIVTTKKGIKVVQVTGNYDNSFKCNFRFGSFKKLFAQYQFQVEPDKTIKLVWCGYGAHKNDGSKVEPLETADLDSCMFDLKKIHNNEAFADCRYISDAIHPGNSEHIETLNSACKNAYTASVAYTIYHPDPTNITLSDLINSGYQPTEGVTITTDNLSDKSGTITCSGPNEWKVSPAVIIVNADGPMKLTPAATMPTSTSNDSDHVYILNSDCKTAYTASVAYTVSKPAATNITLSDLINDGFKPTDGVTIKIKNLSSKSGIIICSGHNEWKVSPAMVTIDNNGTMTLTPAAAMSP